MADSSKTQRLKLANSRKRFKELQELKKKKNQSLVENFQKISSEPTPIDSMTSSSHSSVNNEISECVDNSSSLPNNSNISNESQLPAAFFDTFTEDTDNYNDLQEDKLNTITNYFHAPSSDDKFKDVINNIVNYSTAPFQNVSEIICDERNYSLFPKDSVNYMEENQQLVQDNPLDYGIHKNEDSETLIKNEQDDLSSECEITDTSDRAKLEIMHSNVESLKQLSNQMAELIEPHFYSSSSNDYDHSITDLEKRNLELATLLQQEKLKSEKNNILINELQSKITNSENIAKEKDDMSNFQISREVIKLREELQSHLQTIGMLVAEKTELSVSLNKFESFSKQKSAECEELQARLKASRSRVAELEKELSNFKSEKYQIENTVQEKNAVINILKYDYELLKEQKEELVQDLLETREKLKNVLEENLQLQHSHQDLTSKLASANIKLQQIISIDQQQIENELDKTSEEKFNLENQVCNLNQLLKVMTKERDESVLQYQQYAQQQNEQLNKLTKNIEELQLENENLLKQEQNRIKHISELEKQLQNLQIEQVAFVTNKTDSDIKNDLEHVRELCVQLQMEKISLEENYTKVSNEKDMLLKELEAKNDSLSQLEGLVEQLQGNQPDSVKLLATMESDKIAAAKAVQQNRELKQHIESLEEVFLKLNNDKVELTEQVSQEIKNSKELLQKLQKTEIHLQRLTEAVEIKDRELLDIRQDMVKVQKQVLQNEQVNDLIRHYDAHDNSNHTVQNELKEAKEKIAKLTNEINILKHCLNEPRTSNVVDHKSDSDLIKINVECKEGDKDIAESDQRDESGYNFMQLNENGGASETLDKEVATRYLEEKFKRTMQDIADLKEEKQSLEHLVLQLQGETETIGEYVALYHHQRMMLKQRAIEKDHQLKQLTNDREYLKTQLKKLDDLIRKLVDEKNITAESFSPIKSTNFCEQHSKLNEKINKLSDEMLVHNNNQSSEIADKIIALLSEIKSSNLVEPTENVHHCAWCSGQLITV